MCMMWPLKRGSIHMKFSMTGQEKDDLLIQVTVHHILNNLYHPSSQNKINIQIPYWDIY
jgi:hypothetical protein